MNIHECPASAHSASLTSQREGGFFTLHFYTLTGSDIVCVLTGGGVFLCTLNPRCSVLVDISASFLSRCCVRFLLSDCDDDVR